MTILDVVKFILKHRKQKAFHDWSIPEITIGLHKCIRENTFCHTEENGIITGVMIGHINNTRFHVDNILSTKRNMPVFINYIVRTFPQMTHISTTRHGRFYKEYPIDDKTYNKFMKGTK